MTITAERINVSDRIAQFLKRDHQLLINGEWVEAASGKYFEVHNPATGEVRAMIGGRNFIESNYNRATLALRQSGWRRRSWPGDPA